jgi:hypothetical protein
MLMVSALTWPHASAEVLLSVSVCMQEHRPAS